MSDRKTKFVVQLESRSNDADWVDMYAGWNREHGDFLYDNAVKDYGSTYKVRLVERVMNDTPVRRNYL